MAPINFLANLAAHNRTTVSSDNYFLGLEKDWAANITDFLNAWRDFRDDTNRQIFKAVYGPTCLGAIFPVRQTTADPDRQLTLEENAFIQEILSRTETGGFTEAVLRMVLAGMRREGFFERRSWYIAQQCKKHPRIETLNPQQARNRLREQWLMLHFDEDRALSALSRLLPTREDRVEAVDVVRQIFMLHPNDGAFGGDLAKSILRILELDADSLKTPAA